jgi:predicted RNA-binding Zn ribbon-like protein
VYGGVVNEVALSGPAQLLLAFVNTLDVDEGSDALSDAAALTRWLREAGLLPRGASASDEDLALAWQLRDGLRSVLAGDGREREPQLEQAGDALRLRVRVVGGEPRLEPVDAGVRGALAAVLVAVQECRIAGEWSRLRLCRAEDCRWAFYDASRNRTRVWCAMGVCGNRTKTRTYRARRRGAAEG